MPTAAAAAGPHVVTAVVVARDGARWLPETLAALAGQTRLPDRVVAADTGSTDDSIELLGSAVGATGLVWCEAGTGFGDAVRAALELDGAVPGAPDEETGATRWVWLLHDDCVPAPGALAALLAEAERDPSVAVAGPKLRSLDDRRLLLEIGVTLSRSGRRETRLERREYDQGQHDGVHRVLAVSTAGMLVRRDVWDALGGLDPALPLLRDDVDFGWRANLAGHRVVCVTDAVAFHAEATARGRRRGRRGRGGLGPRRLHRLDRLHANRVLLTNLPLLHLPVAVLSLTLGSLLRGVGHFLGKRPGHAADELTALLAVLGRPDRLVRARAARRRTRAVPARAALPLLAPRSAGRRAMVEAAATVIGARSAAELTGRRRGRSTSAPATGPTSEDDEDLPTWGGGLVRRLVLRPSVGLVAGLAVLAGASGRGLLGDGRLMGGALLPAPATGADLWSRYVGSWHPVGLGGDAVAPPYLAVLGALGTVLGSAERAVSLLLLAAVPLAGLSAYLAVRHLVRSLLLRVWAAVSYALLPPVLGGVAAGRLGTVVLALLLPLAALQVTRALGLDGPGLRSAAGRRRVADRAMWTAALLLAVMTAFVPLTAVAGLALALVGAPMLRGRALARLAGLVAVPVLLLLPWLPAVVEDPQLLVHEAGLPGPALSSPDYAPATALLLHPGGPGLPPLALTAGLVLAGLAALLRPARRRAVLLGWLLVLAGLASAVAVSRLEVTGPTQEAPAAAWPGPGTLLAGAGLLLAAVVGASGARRRVTRSSFGWRQPASGLLVLLAGLGPLAVAGWWAVTGAGDPLDRRDPVLLPAFVAAEGQQPDRPRTLVLRARPDGALGYAVLRADGPRLGDAELSEAAGDTRLGAVVADLASGRGGDAAARLVPYGIRFVLLARPLDAAVARAIEGVPGVIRVSGPSGAVLWRVDYPTGRVRVLAADAPVTAADGSPPQSRILPARQVTADARLPDGRAGRLLVLADPVDDGWQARLDGRLLPATTYDGWAQAFRLPADGGRLRLTHDGGARPVLLLVQLAAVLLVVVLALPQARTVSGRDDPDGDDDVGSDSVDDVGARGEDSARGALPRRSA